MSQNSILKGTKLLLNPFGIQKFTIIRTFVKNSCCRSQEQIFDVLYGDKPPEISKEDMIEIKNKGFQKPSFDKTVPIITCKRPEFNHYKNQTYERYKSVPLASHSWNNSKAKGDHFTINIYPKKSEREQYYWDDTVQNFEDLGLNNYLNESLRKEGIVRPTKIQVEGIPVILAGNCSVLAAETGCGKTLTYLLPMLEKMEEWKKSVQRRPPNHPLALIITPGRELAKQIGDVSRSVGSRLMINTQVITGGHLKRAMLNPRFEYVDVLVATVGAVSKLTSSGIYNMGNVRHVVLDEADTLLDDSFREYLMKFLRRLPFGNTYDNELSKTVQLTLASATMPEKIHQDLLSLVPDNTFYSIEGNRLHHVLPHVPQQFLKLNMTERPGKLLSIVKQSLSKKEPIVVFSNRSGTSDWACMFMNENGINCVNLNGDMPYDIRRGKFEQFQNGEVDVLSCTDVGSRGLDTTRVRQILNFDFPAYIADYIHRCGRTGRVGMPSNCMVTNFIVGKRDVALTQEIETSVRKFTSLPNVKGNITRIIHNRIARNSN